MLAATAGLAVFGLSLVVIGVATRWSPSATDERLPNLTEWFARWQIQHRAPDLDPANTVVLRLFLTFTYRLAAPLARRRVRPGVVTLAGLWVALAVPTTATRWPGLAAGLCALSAVVDGVDGAVAGLSNRASATGFILDSFVDRLAEIAFFGALVVVGGRFSLAAVGWTAMMLLEYTRARAGNAGLDEVGVVTVAERPTRVLCVVFGLLGAAVLPGQAGRSADGASVVALGIAMIGLTQLAITIGRRLATPENNKDGRP